MNTVPGGGGGAFVVEGGGGCRGGGGLFWGIRGTLGVGGRGGGLRRGMWGTWGVDGGRHGSRSCCAGAVGGWCGGGGPLRWGQGTWGFVAPRAERASSVVVTSARVGGRGQGGLLVWLVGVGASVFPRGGVRFLPLRWHSGEGVGCRSWRDVAPLLFLSSSEA